MRNTLKMFKKVASATLALSMVLSLFSGLSVSAKVSTTESFTEDFSGFTSGAVLAASTGDNTNDWGYVNRNSGGSITVEQLDAEHGLSAKSNSGNGGGWEGQQVEFTQNDLVKVGCEVYVPDITNGNRRVELAIGSAASQNDAGFGFAIRGNTFNYFTATNRNSYDDGSDATVAAFDAAGWHDLEMVYDPEDKTVDYYIDGSLKAENVLSNVVSALVLGRISFCIGGGDSMYLDNLYIKKEAKVAKVTVGDVAVYASGSEVLSFPSTGSAVKALVNIANPTTEPYAATLIIATYNAEGVLIDAALESATAVAGTAATDYYTDAISVGNSCESIKAFMWSSLDEMAPIQLKNLERTKVESLINCSFPSAMNNTGQVPSSLNTYQYEAGSVSWSAENAGYGDGNISYEDGAVKLLAGAARPTGDADSGGTTVGRSMKNLNIKVDNKVKKVVISADFKQNKEADDMNTSSKRARSRLTVKDNASKALATFYVGTDEVLTLGGYDDSNESKVTVSGTDYTAAMTNTNGVYGWYNVKMEFLFDIANNQYSVIYKLNDKEVGTKTAITLPTNFTGIKLVDFFNFVNGSINEHAIYFDNFKVDVHMSNVTG